MCVIFQTSSCANSVVQSLCLHTPSTLDIYPQLTHCTHPPLFASCPEMCRYAVKSIHKVFDGYSLDEAFTRRVFHEVTGGGGYHGLGGEGSDTL